MDRSNEDFYLTGCKMRKMRIVLHVVFLIPFILLAACKKKENSAPACEIVSPADGERVIQGDQVTIVVEADDEDGAITEVRLLIDSELTKQTDQSSMTYEWNTSATEVGMHVVSAIASDDGGKAAVANHDVLVDTEGGFNPDLTYGTVTDFDGNSYGTIAIGDQVWMAENLKVTHYSDGSDIPEVTGESEWEALEANGKAWSWYENLAEYGDTSGALYTWAAVMNGAESSNAVPSGVQGVCPAGWHIPSDAEWKRLETFLGMSQESADNYDWRGTDEGLQLMETGFTHWDLAGSGGTNSSGFTAIPGGFRGTKGVFYSFGQYATFWTATGLSGTDKAWYRSLFYDNHKIYRQYNFMKQGFSVRCVMD
jgi:uncharacterized protein (TIGR02145 family)